MADAALEVADPRHLAVYDLFLAAGSYALPFLAVPDFLAVAVICSRLIMKRARKRAQVRKHRQTGVTGERELRD